MTIRSKIGRYVVAAASVAGALAAPAVSADVLRVCADPDNLPFSKAEGSERGMYIELAELVGKRLGSSVEYVWWLTFNQRKALRNTILQDGCDAWFALPADADYKLRGLQRTQAFINVSYAVVVAPSVSVAGLADLKGKRVGVMHGSPPHILLSQQEGFVTSSFRAQQDAFDALAKGELDLAILWGPSAGYENLKRFQGRWRITPVSGEGLGGQMAVAVRRGQDSLVAGIGKALLDLQPDIVALAEKYGFPQSKPVQLAGSLPGPQEPVRSQPPARPDTLAQATTVRAGFIKTVTTAVPAVAVAQADAVGGLVEGRMRFNNICSHCHGNDGASPVSERDLRRLKLRYKDNWRETAITTIKNGRSDAGMPSWKATYSEKEIEDILDFLVTIQK